MKTSAKMGLYTVYIPLNHGDGQPILPSRLRWIVSEIARVTGGCTLLPPGDGLWMSDQQLYHDQVVPIQIVAQRNAETETFFRGLVGELAAVLAQREIFIHCTTVMTLASQPGWENLSTNLA